MDSLNNLSKAGYDSLNRGRSRCCSTPAGSWPRRAEQSDAILSWSKNLDLVTATLASSDPDVRRLLTTGQTSAVALSNLLQKQGGDITKIVKELAPTVKNAIAPTGYATNALFAMLSALSADAHAPAPGDGRIHFGIVLETNNPAACTAGYESTQQMMRDQAQEPDVRHQLRRLPVEPERAMHRAAGVRPRRFVVRSGQFSRTRRSRSRGTTSRRRIPIASI